MQPTESRITTTPRGRRRRNVSARGARCLTRRSTNAFSFGACETTHTKPDHGPAALPAVLVRDRRRKSRTRPEAQAGSQSRRSVASVDDAVTRARRSRSARGLSRLQRGLVGPRRRDVRGRARWPAIRDVREPRARDSGAPAPTIPPTSTPSPAWRPALFHAIAPRLLKRGDARSRRRRALDGRRGPREVGECAEYTTW